MTALLTADELTVDLGGVRAVDGVSLDVGEGEMIGLIGPNGAGKTTFLNAVCGFVPSAGDVRLKQRSISGVRPARRARLGLARTFQQAQLLDRQTVWENLHVAADVAGRGGRKIAEVVEIVGLEDRLSIPCDSLSTFERFRVEIARALIPRPALILLDEPAAGLAGAQVEVLARLLDRVRGLAEAAMLLVDHNMELVLGICPRVVVLDFGRLIFDGTARAAQQSPAVLEAYLGDA